MYRIDQMLGFEGQGMKLGLSKNLGQLVDSLVVLALVYSHNLG